MALRTFHIDAFWLRAEPLKRIFAALSEIGDVRVVGGAVRNTLLGQPMGDVDLATTARPDPVARVLRDAGIKVVETGVEHGTLTAISAGQPFEITTLRRDVLTDGRRARVVFTEDWEIDASRRDFTMNALFVDPSGDGYDYVGGYEDCLDRHVRFIGDPAQRIVEDYLRILRLFRIHAAYGRGGLDPIALDAALAHKHGLRTLSVERIHHEVSRLLVAPGAPVVMDVVADGGFLAPYFVKPLDARTFHAWFEAETASGRDKAAPLGYAALTGFDPEAFKTLATRLKFSRKDRDRGLAAMRAADDMPPRSVTRARALIYHHGVQAFSDAVIVSLARGVDLLDYTVLLAEARRFSPPAFPISGYDLMDAGVSGSEIGTRLKRLEQVWIDSDFSLSREALLTYDREQQTGRSA